MPQFTLIGHRYLGPGNPLDNGEPVNSADRIAQQHDFEYSRAKTKEDIFNSDRRAIANFVDDFANKPSIGNIVGIAGLSIKHGAEKILDRVIYPPIAGNYGTTKSQTWLYH